MAFYKLVEDNEVKVLYNQEVPVDFAEEITEEEYNTLLEEMMKADATPEIDPMQGFIDELVSEVASNE